MTSLSEVVKAWRHADPKHIHPTREHVSEQAYWDSGRPQAELVYELVGSDAFVLDFGCGDGRIAIPMAKLGLHVLAVDASPEMLERLEHQAKVQGVSGEIATHESDGTVIAPSDEWDGFDAVNARAVFIHHAHKDVATIVSNLAAMLKPGGLFIADWPVGEHHERIDWIDVTTWTFDHRQQVAEAAGLELVSEGVPTVRPSVWRKREETTK